MVYYINNKFINEEDATLHISDLSIQRGFALFDYFRTRNNIPLFLDDYLDRFYNSCKLLALQPLQLRQELKEIISELIYVNKTPDCGFKIILTGGYSIDGYAQASPNLIITQSPLSLSYNSIIEKGAKIITYEYLRQLPAIKSTNYLMAVWLQSKIKEQQADDVLYYSNNLISELPRANFFIVDKNNVLVTPKENVLHGITRKKVLELAKHICKVEERPVTLEELFTAKEAFLTSTTKRLQPVIKINDHLINNGKSGNLTTQLSEAFFQLETNYLNNPH